MIQFSVIILYQVLVLVVGQGVATTGKINNTAFVDMVQSINTNIVHHNFGPVYDKFSYSHLLGLEEGALPPVRAGEASYKLQELFDNLPALINPKDIRLNNLWRYLFDGEEERLMHKLQKKIDKGEPIYTNRQWKNSILSELETWPLYQRLLGYCATPDIDYYGTKQGIFCAMVVDFGLTIFIDLINSKELLICAGSVLVVGDARLCLALILYKLINPATPYLRDNVNLIQ